uniref:Uncharacterized protein n=1 Tax=Angiostrongylus cantonensis TaxID=6313 RepID=A0A0K0DMK0_ANGCA
MTILFTKDRWHATKDVKSCPSQFYEVANSAWHDMRPDQNTLKCKRQTQFGQIPQLAVLGPQCDCAAQPNYCPAGPLVHRD